MINNLTVLGVVPARSGSKGLPGKNIKPFCGKPLLVWSIDSGRASRYIDNLVVSTDTLEIAEIARAAGADVPFLRPAELATDKSPSIDAILHCVDNLTWKGREFDIIVLLEPTSPLREAADIDLALELLLSDREAKSVVSICHAEGGHPAFLYGLSDKKKLVPFASNQGLHLRRQDLSPVFFPEGTIYVSYVSTLRERRSFYHDETYGFPVPRWKAIEVDDIFDFVQAEALYKYRLTNNLL